MKKMFRKSLAFALALVMVFSGLSGAAAFAEEDASAESETPVAVDMTEAKTEPEAKTIEAVTEELETESAADEAVPEETETEAAVAEEQAYGYLSVAIADENGKPLTMTGPNDEATFALLDSSDSPARDHYVAGFNHFGFWSYETNGAEALDLGPEVIIDEIPAGAYWLLTKTSPAGYELNERFI